MASLFVSGIELQLTLITVNQNHGNSVLLAMFQDRQTCKACVPLGLISSCLVSLLDGKPLSYSIHFWECPGRLQTDFLERESLKISFQYKVFVMFPCHPIILDE